MADYKKMIPFILRWEGGYVNDPLDRGGETNKGITIATWRNAGHDTSEKIPVLKVGSKTYTSVTKSLYEMTDEQWGDIFKNLYWDKWKADNINNQSIAEILVDWVWASGVWGIKKPQALLGVTADGIVGTKTLAAVNNSDPKKLFEDIRNARIEFVENIVKKTPSQARFINGWKNRINSIKFEP